MKRTDRPHIDLQIACCAPGAGEKLNLDGDQQSDLMVHGGVDKAVYVYPSEHYAFWRAELPNVIRLN